jgi:hypothetical protein
MEKPNPQDTPKPRKRRRQSEWKIPFAPPPLKGQSRLVFPDEIEGIAKADGTGGFTPNEEQMP